MNRYQFVLTKTYEDYIVVAAETRREAEEWVTANAANIEADVAELGDPELVSTELAYNRMLHDDGDADYTVPDGEPTDPVDTREEQRLER